MKKKNPKLREHNFNAEKAPQTMMVPINCTLTFKVLPNVLENKSRMKYSAPKIQ